MIIILLAGKCRLEITVPVDWALNINSKITHK